MRELLRGLPRGLEETRQLWQVTNEISAITHLRALQRNNRIEVERMEELLGLRSQGIIHLLSLRRDRKMDFPVSLNRFGDEKFHAFSRNMVRLELCFPDLNNADPLYFVSKLSDLRKPDEMLLDSEDALSLANPNQEFQETRSAFISRTASEIRDIRDERKDMGRGSLVDYSGLMDLKTLEEYLVIGRLLPFVGTSPIGGGISVNRLLGNKLRVTVVTDGRKMTSEIDLSKKRSEAHQKILQSV